MFLASKSYPRVVDILTLRNWTTQAVGFIFLHNLQFDGACRDVSRGPRGLYTSVPAGFAYSTSYSQCSRNHELVRDISSICAWWLGGRIIDLVVGAKDGFPSSRKFGQQIIALSRPVFGDTSRSGTHRIEFQCSGSIRCGETARHPC